MKRTREEFITILYPLHQVITVVPKEEYEIYLREAEKFSPNDKDVIYFALALKMKCSIWSNDIILKKQDKVPVLNTKELLDQLNK